MIDRFTETLGIGAFELTEIVLDNLGLGETTSLINNVGVG